MTSMMKAVFRILIIFISIASANSFAQENGVGKPIKIGSGRHGTRDEELVPSKPGPGKLVGHCTLLAGGENLREGPCVNLALVLNDANGGHELLTTRTDKKGNFAFEVAQAGKFKIASWSHLIEVISPTDVLHAGGLVDLKLRQK